MWIAYEMCRWVMIVLMTTFYDNDSDNMICLYPQCYVQDRLNEVKALMLDNIDRVLERGERLDALVQKSDALNFDTLNFRTEARRLRTEMVWRQARTISAMALGGVGTLYVVAATVCGWDLRGC